MSRISPERLYHLTLNKSALNTEFGVIDRSKPYMPEALTQLFHTPCYEWLSKEQKLRYNQLFALRSIEQLMTLEERFIALVISRCKRTSVMRDKQALQFCMAEMVVEEQQHFAMFHRLNRQAEPSLYLSAPMIFARMSKTERAALEVLAKLPGLMLFLLWSLLILEEFSTYISRQMVKCQAGTLGELEVNFVSAHREHLKDEARHVAICANAISDIYQSSSSMNRKLNALVLRTFMREYMTPKRGGIRVLYHLQQEFPELITKLPDMEAAVRAQRPDTVIWQALNNPKAMPVTHHMLHTCPEYSLSI